MNGMSSNDEDSRIVPQIQDVEPSQIQLQLINEHKEFSNSLHDHVFDVWKLGNQGFNYNVVAVFGSQSTGKSTLLNSLFGTDFSVMENQERRQTTKGIWMSQGKNMNTLIMDVEGTDGRERGEDQDFERKSALFSLSVSQVMIVNMWENSIGLYHGANMALLKTVFEVNLQLFQTKGKSKTLLLFVIRDYLGTTPFENLCLTLIEDLNNLWKSLTKPNELMETQFNDFFDTQFFPLPHKLLQPKEFFDEVAKLRQLFIDPQEFNYVFQKCYHRGIPADGFPKYAASIWQQIMENRDLDLPTQQELLAQFRCDEISLQNFEEFSKLLEPLKSKSDAGQIIEDLGEQIVMMRDQSLERFDCLASRYHKEVYMKKRGQHCDKLHASLRVLCLNQIKNLFQKTIHDFTSFAKGRIGSPDFFKQLETSLNDSLTHFISLVKELHLKMTDWNFDQERENLEKELFTLQEHFQKEHMDKFLLKIQNQFYDELCEEVSPLTENVQRDLWKKIIQLFLNLIEKYDQMIEEHLQGVHVKNHTLISLLQQFHIQAWETFIRKMKEDFSEQMAVLKLRDLLEERFRYDQEGLPKVWKPSDDIDTHFRRSKDEVHQLLPVLCRIDLSTFFDRIDELFPSDYSYHSHLPLLSSSQQSRALSRFKKEADALYLEAKRSVIITTSRIPYWIFIVIAVLGWNEFFTILTSPIYLIFFAFLSIAGYFLYLTNLWVPFYAVMNSYMDDLKDKGKAAVIDALSTPSRTNSTISSTSENIELKNSNSLENLHRRHTKTSIEDDSL